MRSYPHSASQSPHADPDAPVGIDHVPAVRVLFAAAAVGSRTSSRKLPIASSIVSYRAASYRAASSRIVLPSQVRTYLPTPTARVLSCTCMPRDHPKYAQGNYRPVDRGMERAPKWVTGFQHDHQGQQTHGPGLTQMNRLLLVPCQIQARGRAGVFLVSCPCPGCSGRWRSWPLRLPNSRSNPATH